MIRYQDAVHVESGEIISIQDVPTGNQRPAQGTYRCPICDGILKPAQGDVYEWHFRHKDVLDSECPEQHRIHWLAKNGLNHLLKGDFQKDKKAFIKIKKKYKCNCPVHLDADLAIPDVWDEEQIVDLRSVFDSPILVPDPTRRWAPVLTLKHKNRTIRIEVNSGKSLSDRSQDPCFEFFLNSSKDLAHIENCTIDQIPFILHHWPNKTEDKECGQIDDDIWWGVEYVSGKNHVEESSIRSYLDFKRTRGNSQSVSKVKCIPHIKAHDINSARRILFQPKPIHLNSGNDSFIIDFDKKLR